MGGRKESVTRTVESGAFIRTTLRVGKKRKQQTKRIKKNDKKVILGKIGDFEVYVYPYDFPDTVFIGKFPVSTQIDQSGTPALLSAYNKIRWYFSNQPYSKPTSRKGANSRRRAIRKAYNQGLNDIKKPKTGSK